MKILMFRKKYFQFSIQPPKVKKVHTWHISWTNKSKTTYVARTHFFRKANTANQSQFNVYSCRIVFFIVYRIFFVHCFYEINLGSVWLIVQYLYFGYYLVSIFIWRFTLCVHIFNRFLSVLVSVFSIVNSIFAWL